MEQSLWNRSDRDGHFTLTAYLPRFYLHRALDYVLGCNLLSPLRSIVRLAGYLPSRAVSKELRRSCAMYE